jgi:hypothetical protein
MLLLPAVVQAQFTFTTNNGALAITGYTGPGGTVVIPETTNGYPITAIGDLAFFYCGSLTNVVIPQSITNIGIEAFDNCSSLTGFTVDALNSFYSSVDGALFDKQQTTLIQFPEAIAGGYAIPGTVTNIADFAFDYCTGLTLVTIPDSVLRIGNVAFDSCDSLTNVTIGNNVTYIGGNAFSFCTRLPNVTVPDSVTTLDSAAFEDCASLTGLKIGNQVRSLGNGAFSSCASLTNVTMPVSVKAIGDYAFAWCTNLTRVYFQGDAPVVGFGVFSRDTLQVYALPGTTGWAAFTANTGLSTIPWLLTKPTILDFEPNFGVQTNRFGFTISWATNPSIVVEACTNLADPAWQSVQTNTLTEGTAYFNDPQWTNYPGRFYRLRSP